MYMYLWSNRLHIHYTDAYLNGVIITAPTAYDVMHTALSTPLLTNTPVSTCMAFVTAALAMYTFSTMGAMLFWTPHGVTCPQRVGPVWQLKWERGPDEVLSHTIDNGQYHTHCWLCT